MNIGDAAKQSGLPAKTIRYYEDIGLVAPGRAGNGYRDFSGTDLHKLAFVQRARSLGFSIEECRALLSLYDDRDRASADVKDLAKAHLAQIEEKNNGGCKPCRKRSVSWSINAMGMIGPTARYWTGYQGRREKQDAT